MGSDRGACPGLMSPVDGGAQTSVAAKRSGVSLARTNRTVRRRRCVLPVSAVEEDGSSPTTERRLRGGEARAVRRCAHLAGRTRTVRPWRSFSPEGPGWTSLRTQSRGAGGAIPRVHTRAAGARPQSGCRGSDHLRGDGRGHGRFPRVRGRRLGAALRLERRRHLALPVALLRPELTRHLVLVAGCFTTTDGSPRRSRPTTSRLSSSPASHCSSSVAPRGAPARIRRRPAAGGRGRKASASHGSPA